MADPQRNVQPRPARRPRRRHADRQDRNRCTIGYGNDAPCPINWNELLAIGKRKSGCNQKDGWCTVKIPKTAPQTKYTVVEVGITSAQGTGYSRDYYAIISGDYFQLAGHVTDENAKPVHGVWVQISGPADASKRTDASGGYSALLEKGQYVVTTDRYKPVASADCVVDGRQCDVNLSKDRVVNFTGGTPEFTIDVADRYDGLDHNGDHIVDYFPPTDHQGDPPLEPTRWLVTFALKGYPKSCNDGTNYAWSITSEKGGVYRGDGCRFLAKLNSQGKFKVTLTVSSEGGAAVSSDEDFEIKDTLIVSLGDSFGSGEGVPEPTGSAYAWESDRCHTSSQSGFALAARRIALAAKADDDERQHSYHRVTFLHLACSGGLAGPGITQSYEGIEPGSATTELPPQLTQIEQRLGKRLGEINVITLSAGGNDIGFSPIIHACASIPPLDFADCDSLNGFVKGNARFHNRLATLEFHYKQIHKRLAELGRQAGIDLNSRLVITQYPDFMHDQKGALCTGPGTFSKIEWGWTVALLGQLNDAIEKAAAKYGWHVVKAHVAAFHTHGYCSTGRWMDSLSDWALNPAGVGNAGATPTGVFHPNIHGQEAYAAALTPVLDALIKSEK